MGNCQAAEAATVVIHHPEGRLERVYWSLSASQVMAANPGHYVALLVTTTTTTTTISPTASAGGGGAATTVKHLKLLRPDDTLLIGHVYRLVSFEEVLKEFASKKHVKLSKVLVTHKEKSSNKKGRGGRPVKPEYSPPAPPTTTTVAEEEGGEMMMVHGIRRSSGGSSSSTRHQGGGGGGGCQWRPALQSIAEVGS